MAQTMKGLALLAAAAVTLTGCLLDIDFNGTRFNCEDGKCPDGFSCVEGTCVAQSGGGDGGVGGDASDHDAAPPDGGPLLSCDEQFSASVGYMLCVEEATTCEFFVQTEVATPCNDICPLYDAECVNSFDATAGTECTREEEGLCTAPHTGQICICSRG